MTRNPIKDNDQRGGRAEEVGTLQEGTTAVGRGRSQDQGGQSSRSSAERLRWGCVEHTGSSKKCHGEDAVPSEAKQMSKT